MMGIKTKTHMAAARANIRALRERAGLTQQELTVTAICETLNKVVDHMRRVGHARYDPWQ
ncbi:MAG: hypothetical protein K6G90_02040 [Clostridia bacterium]|nr:hypothetical protein [Clostridia bacterium]